MFLALLITLGQGTAVEYQRLFGGMEIYLLSVTVFASTQNDLDNSSADFAGSRIYSILTGLLLPFTIVSSMVFAVVFINERVQDFGVSEAFIANLGIGLGFVASVVCVPLQFVLSVTERAERST